MGRVKVPDNEFNVDELDVEWSDNDFSKYDGEIPETGEIVNGCIVKMWWTFSNDNTRMIKALFEADDTAGEYEGLPIWENLTFKPSAAFKYGPFLEFFGLTLRDIKNKMSLSDADDNQGAPIESIAGFAPDTDSALCAVVVKRSKYNGEWKAEVGEWLEYDEDREADDEPEEEPPPARPARTKAASNGKAPSKPAARRASRAAPVEEPDVESDDEPEEEEAPPPRTSVRRARGQAAAKPATPKPAAKPAARGRRGKPADDDPPF